MEMQPQCRGWSRQKTFIGKRKVCLEGEVSSLGVEGRNYEGGVEI